MMRLPIRLPHVLGMIVFVSFLGGAAKAQPGSEDLAVTFKTHVQGIVDMHCYQCHNEEDSSGNVNLAQDRDHRMLLEHRKTWLKVRQVVESGEMPPEDSLDEDQRRRLIEYLDASLSEIVCDSEEDPRTPVARRLTNNEYTLAVRDLTGLDLPLSQRFAPDPVSFGFAGLGSSVGLSAVNVEQYAETARMIAGTLVKSRQSRPRVFANTFGKSLMSREAYVQIGDRDLYARRVIQRFASRAFRRPVDRDYLDGLMRVYHASMKRDSNPIVAIAMAMRTVMMSPRFFMRIEQTQIDATEAYAVDPYDLASRLSFFLWSAPPDDTLLKLAQSGKLLSDDVLRQQTRRMLASDRVRDGLVRNFFGQWLQLNTLQQHHVDQNEFPDFDPAIRKSMLGEVAEVLAVMVRRDLPVTTLVDAKFTFLNRPLAAHYGLPDPTGESEKDRLVPVRLSDRRRGGVLTSAAILTLQADPGRTNVPRRGNYVAGTFLGDPPPPPPPDVPALEESASDEDRPLRERLEEHRRNPACASCHAKMDPLGFALENYDAVGRWREKDAGSDIDASGELPGGDSFDGPVELKDLLLRSKEKLIRNLTEKLIVYAVGRGLHSRDECIVRDAVAAAADRGDRFSALVETIVLSRPFRYRGEPL